MSVPVVVNRVREGFYLDSVALMRLSQEIGAIGGVETASLMIGTQSNRDLLADAGLMAPEAEAAGPNDLIMAVRAESSEAAQAALDEAEVRLKRRDSGGGTGETWNPRTFDTALAALPDANIALISVPGAFAAREARVALRHGLHVMMFSDNVPVTEEVALKHDAQDRGLLLMGPDCGTALIGGVPLAFANEVPTGVIGAVAASGTGLQEVSTLIGRAGGGLSHGIGVGGRDLSTEVGGIMTLCAIDALDADPGTERIVLISKPPAADVAGRIFERVAQSKKHFTVCFLGMDAPDLPGNATFAPTLRAAAEDALDGMRTDAGFDADGIAAKAKEAYAAGRSRITGLYSGGTMCAEAQVILRSAGLSVASNAPIPGAGKISGDQGEGHVLLDLGADEYTLGRPHPMIEPSVRDKPLATALADSRTAVVLLDIVIGHGAHQDPAAHLAASIAGAPTEGPLLVASVCGTEEDPQGYSSQVETLRDCGVIVAPSNAHAAEVAVSIAQQKS